MIAALAITHLCCAMRRPAPGQALRPVLSDINLTAAPGSLTAILGASGSGKTTLLRLICGFERPDSGSIAIDGRVVAGNGIFIPPERRRIGYVAQDGALFPHLDVAANILFGLRGADRRPERAASLLRLVGLPADYGCRPPQELSGGEQQRVALARALAPAPRLVLLDEPFSALDAALRVETRRAVAEALHAVGATALLVTHDQGEALSVGHQVAVLRDGVLAQVDTPEALYRHPADAALAQFVGDAVLLRGTAQGWMVTCALGALQRDQSSPDGPVQILVRPEQLRLIEPDGTHPTGVVSEITYFGHDAAIRLVMDGPSLPAPITTRVAGHAAPALGTRRGVGVEGLVVTYADQP